MKADSSTPRKKWPVRRTVAISVIAVLLIVAALLYNNFNRLLSEALLKSFESSIISDVYELKFEKLNVNPLEGSIRVFNVTLLPREKPLRNYSYINSSFRLETKKLTLNNVEIFTLLKFNQLILDDIYITKPDVELTLNGNRHIMVPFKDLTENEDTTARKKTLDSFKLNELQLIDASVHITNSAKQREFTVKNFNISLADLQLTQNPGEYLTYFKRVNLSVGVFDGNLQKGAFKYIGLEDFKIGIDSLNIKMALDTVIYHFHDFYSAMRKLNIQTADSLFHVTMQSFDLSYENKSIILRDLSFKPNVSHAVLQQEHEYQHTEFSGTVGTLVFGNVNFDSLIYSRKIFIDRIIMDRVAASVFKDKTKPIDKNRMPAYLGQIVKRISVPIRIGYIKATTVQLENTERKADSSYAKVKITKASLDVKNITNQPTNDGLTMSAEAYIEDKAHTKLELTFQYLKPQFSFKGSIEKFNLPDLNSLLQAYTPAKINEGIADKIEFSGVAEQTKASGTLKFLYHDLEIDLELQEQAKWKSSVVAFAANTILDSSNPASDNLPPRIVKFQISRDMNKGFINVIIKSVLNGLKETMIMSKENRKNYKAEKKKAKDKKK